MSVQAIYQVYLRHLTLQERLNLIRLLADEIGTVRVTENPRIEEKKDYSVMEFAGVGKADAMEEDAQSYINKLRSEWE